ncbi:MAG TPA: response regulator [Opitutus sp.]|nr:response regulator [Opitutus sp.]
MNPRQSIRLLLVEDSPSDLALARELFAESPSVGFELEHASRLVDALHLVGTRAFDAVLLDLGLPDSRGVETFIQLHQQAPDVPILVLTAAEDDEVGEKTLRGGAEDYLVKRQVQANLLRNSVRYAVLRSKVRHAAEEQRQRDEQSREIEGIDRLSTPAATNVTARIYSGSPLRENAPDEFKASVAEYYDLLGLALEQRIFQSGTDCSERLRELALQLGFLRGGPRDVVEIHTTALKKRLRDVPPPKARAFLEEGRIAVLELMGHLTSYYRSFYSVTKGKDSKS